MWELYDGEILICKTRNVELMRKAISQRNTARVHDVLRDGSYYMLLLARNPQ